MFTVLETWIVFIKYRHELSLRFTITRAKVFFFFFYRTAIDFKNSVTLRAHYSYPRHIVIPKNFGFRHDVDIGRAPDARSVHSFG